MRTCAQVLVDEAFDLLQLTQVRGLQEGEQVHGAGLLSGHGGRAAGGQAEVRRRSGSQCPVLPGGHSVSRHRCGTHTTGLDTFLQSREVCFEMCVCVCGGQLFYITERVDVKPPMKTKM